MVEFVLASGNAGKLREFRRCLEPASIRVRPQSEFDIPEAEETGTTFVENAIIKARNAAMHSGLPAIGDDSGLRVDALNGAPGVRSARFAGSNADDQDNNRKLLAAMQGQANRQASFVCVLAVMQSADDPTPRLFEGRWFGEILQQPRGSGGFGYDPLFLLPDLGQSVAELAPEMKNRISHRGIAIQGLIEALR